MIKVGYSTLSILPSDNMPDPGVIRAPRGTNPVNATQAGHRETAPLAAGATPRVMHPALNNESWSRSYAQSRSEPKMARPKSRYRRSKRTSNDRRGKR